MSSEVCRSDVKSVGEEWEYLHKVRAAFGKSLSVVSEQCIL